MNDREQIAWLYRRVGFGLAPGQLDQLAAKGVAVVLDELLDPDAHDDSSDHPPRPPLVPAAKDPWEGVDFGEYDPKQDRKYLGQALRPWLITMATTSRPLHEWIRWFWHGHFVSTIREVKQPQLMVNQLRLFGREGLGDFRTLLRSVTIDGAMLVYLDGVKNKKGSVNENYGRELLELFGLGIGNYTEEDVRAGAEALTGWMVDRATGAARFMPRQHDDTRRTYLGQSDVHDLDSVIDAVVGHEACPVFITGALARAILGPSVDAGLINRLAAEFKAGGLQIKPLVRAVLEAGLNGAGAPMVIAPVPWLTGAIRSLGSDVGQSVDAVGAGLVPAGQLPLDAPNVAGWPGGRNWLTSSATVARFNMASALSGLSPVDSPAMKAAGAADLPALADALGHPEGFGDATKNALGQVRDAGAASVVTIALSSPELVLA